MDKPFATNYFILNAKIEISQVIKIYLQNEHTKLNLYPGYIPSFSY